MRNIRNINIRYDSVPFPVPHDNYPFTWKIISLHMIIVGFLSTILVIIINSSDNSSWLDCFSSVGSISSIYGIVLTLWQLNKVKRVAQAAKDAAMSKTKEIEMLTTYSSLQREKEMCNSIVSYINGKQFEAAAIKLDTIREHLIEIITKQSLYEDDIKIIHNIISDIGNDSVNMRKYWMESFELDTCKVIEHIISLSNILAKLFCKIKK